MINFKKEFLSNYYYIDLQNHSTDINAEDEDTNGIKRGGNIMKISKEIITFNTVQEAFCWAFNERENFQRVKSYFKMSDEIENVTEITNLLNAKTLENYLINNSYVYKNHNKYEFEY